METLPSKIGKYEVKSILGKGAMGIVYQATDPDIPAEVAIKSILSEHLQGDNRNTLLQRFRNEVKAGRRLKHANIVATYAYHEFGNSCYIVMEYVAGKPLSELLNQSRSFEVEKSLDIMEQLLSALDCAHSHGVIHRDIKPGNIMIKGESVVQVTDFGVAKLEASDATLTLTNGAIIGSPSYMSPEQCSGKPIDKRTDLFSAGIVFYELLTGKKPFTGENLMGTLQNILTVDPVKPSRLNNTLSSAYDDVAKKALAKNPDDRFQSAAEFTTAILELRPDKSKATANSSNAWSGLRFFVPLIILGSAVTAGYYTMDSESPIVDPETPAEGNDKVPVDLDRINRMLGKFDCSSLDAKQNPDGKITVSGYLKSDDILGLERNLEEAVGTSGFDTSLTPLDSEFCQEVAALMPYVELNKTENYGLRIKPYRHSNRYVEGEMIRLAITPPRVDMYLYADYLQSDGTVVHLVPVNDQQHTLNKDAHELLLGDSKKQWEVVPPFGKDLIFIIASTTPLIDSVRDEIEEAKDYFAALKSSLKKDGGNSVIADYFYITTGPVSD